MSDKTEKALEEGNGTKATEIWNDMEEVIENVSQLPQYASHIDSYWHLSLSLSLSLSPTCISSFSLYALDYW